ncbi:MAG: elongation factor 1-beta [Candidatus Aenigmarchaeota archaeon]|nr:elongation factor 1-beta [Candidatus Aenigmarchaeota archaeon]
MKIMGTVIVVFRVMPESPDSAAAVKAALEKLKPNRLEEEPVAFGLTAYKFTKLIPDASGEIEKLEESLGKVKGVQSVENIRTSLSL